MAIGVAQVCLMSLSWCPSSAAGNNGQPPVDNIDACCEEHDNCYDNVMTSGSCDLPHPMLVSYSWSVVSTNYDDGTTLVCDDCATTQR